jgi:predicted dehydrogenase
VTSEYPGRIEVNHVWVLSMREDERDRGSESIEEKPVTRKPLRLAVIGAGFWARFQVHAWQELATSGRVELACICNRTREKAEDFKRSFGFQHVYSEPERMFAERHFDLVDIVTSTPTHKPLVIMSAKYRVPAIVQKPIACSLKDARDMVFAAQQAGIPLVVHENYRWWSPTRKVKALVEQGVIGDLRDLVVQWKSGGYDYYENQPYFKSQKRFIIGEVGVHLVDIARFLAGADVREVCGQSQRFNPDINGEDFARIVLTLANNTTAILELGVETLLENERPPSVFIAAFGTEGTIELGPDFRLAVTRMKKERKVTEVTTVSIPTYPWAGAYPVALACMVDANAHYVDSILHGRAAETSGHENLNTIAATLGSYLAIEKKEVVNLEDLGTLEGVLEENRIGYPNHPNE